jgi:hypothetical protein
MITELKKRPGPCNGCKNHWKKNGYKAGVEQNLCNKNLDVRYGTGRVEEDY